MAGTHIQVIPPAEKPAPAAPHLHATEGAKTVFLVTLVAACGPLLAGVVLFGWRALIIAGISVLSCAAFEDLYYRITRAPSLLGRSHAYLTGVLLALTLPPFAPWYVPVVAAAFAIILGKAFFGGVGHFLWQPALVGRLAVAVLFSGVLSWAQWPLLAQDQLVIGDVNNCRQVENYHQWRGRPAPKGSSGFLLTPPRKILSALTSDEPAFSAIAYPSSSMQGVEDVPLPLPPAASGPAPAASQPALDAGSDGLRESAAPLRPVALSAVPAVNDLFYGAWPGGIGETCAVVIVIAGLYLIYRNYVKGHLPLMFILSAALVVAIAPVNLVGPNNTVETVWWPAIREGPDVGLLYVSYQLLSGELLLAAFFLATEMTSRPVTTGGQVIFGIGCGVLAMLMRLYTDWPIPCYMAVLAMNTLTPLIDSMYRPRVLGMRRFGRGE